MWNTTAYMVLELAPSMSTIKFFPFCSDVVWMDLYYVPIELSSLKYYRNSTDFAKKSYVSNTQISLSLFLYSDKIWNFTFSLIHLIAILKFLITMKHIKTQERFSHFIQFYKVYLRLKTTHYQCEANVSRNFEHRKFVKLFSFLKSIQFCNTFNIYYICRNKIQYIKYIWVLYKHDRSQWYFSQ